MKFALVTLCVMMTLGLSAQSEYITSYHENGSIKVLYSVQDDVVKADFYYDNGKIREVGYLKDGERHGHWQSWSEEGAIVAEAFYRKGQKSGVWLINHENGRLQYELVYRKGKRVAVTEWDKLGNSIAQR